jgi:hypothetical protein
MGFVVLDEIDGLGPAGTGQPKEHVDPLKDRGIAAMTNRFDVDLDAETPARNASAGVICSPGPPRCVGSSMTSW